MSSVIRNVWTLSAIEKVNVSIFINFHKRCGQLSAFESFRASLLLSLGKMIVSEHSFKEDENEYVNLVKFVSVDNVHAESRNLKFLNPMRIRTNFCKKFAPAKLLLNSGISLVSD